MAREMTEAQRETVTAAARHEWSTSKDLQAEFPDFADYAALRRAEFRGDVRVLGGARKPD